ncbi:MAG: hypothetical protein AMXMBFR84_45820 [Candidatus Hydrogenedentota bacterium]
MHRMVWAFGVIVAAMTGSAFPQSATTTGSDVEMTRQLERTAAAFKMARNDAQTNNKPALEKSLTAAHTVWRETYQKYRTYTTSDRAWATDFDAIQALLTNATNALSPGDNVAQCATHVQTALETLEGVRSRNGVPDLQGTIAEIQDSLGKLNTNVRKLQGKTPSVDDVQTYVTMMQDMQTAWKRFIQGLIDFNALGLGDGDLRTMQTYINNQDKVFQALISAINSPNTSAMLASLQQSQTQLEALRDQIDAIKNPDETTSVSEEATEMGLVPVEPQEEKKARHPLFPLLRPR